LIVRFCEKRQVFEEMGNKLPFIYLLLFNQFFLNPCVNPCVLCPKRKHVKVWKIKKEEG
jgi:hypothetical protein